MEVEAGRMGGGLEGVVLIEEKHRLWRGGIVGCTLLLVDSLLGSCRACSFV